MHKKAIAKKPIAKKPTDKKPTDKKPTDDKTIYDIYVAGRGSAALAVAVHLGLFALLAEQPRTEEEVATGLHIAPRGARSLLRALRGLKLVSLADGQFSLTAASEQHLVPGRSAYLGGLIDLEIHSPLTPRSLLEAVRTGKAQVYADETWSAHANDPEQAARFTRAMHSISQAPAKALVTHYDFSPHRLLLDVGGGSGVYAAEALVRHRDLRAVVLDIEAVCPLAEAHFAERSVSHRGSTRVANMFRDDFAPASANEPADVILFAQILHDWPMSRCAQLLAKAYDALPPGGVVLIHEKLVADDGGPVANALVDLDMLFWTEGQQLTQDELLGLLREAGFSSCACSQTVGYWTLGVGHKPSA
jgi:cyclopropane fatty-acyl-phospholipid synthase-like methyltransferase